MINILVTGSKGQLGSELRAVAEDQTFDTQDFKLFYTDRSNLDITDEKSLKVYCDQNSIEVIINCAAYTAVDKAESDEAAAYAINHLATRALASLAKERAIKLIHISTDYVFDGSNYKPYTEADHTNPQSVYGASKLKGEEAIINIGPQNTMMIRTSWVYSSFGANFVKTMLRLGKERDTLGVIFDQVGTPTYAKDLAVAIFEMIKHPASNNSEPEIYHFSNEGVCSWYDFAKTIFELSGVTCDVNPIETKAYPTPATRPHYSLLNKGKIKTAFDMKIPYWKDSVAACLETLGEKV